MAIVEYVKDYVREHGGLFIHPNGVTGRTTILQKDEEGMLVPTEVEGLQGRETLEQHHRGWVGGFRMKIENIHDTIKKNDIFKNRCSWQLTEPFSRQMIQQFK